MLFGAPGVPGFRPLHAALAMLARAGLSSNGRLRVRYVLRLVPVPLRRLAGTKDSGHAVRLALPGYGVELAYKDTEYNASDDRLYADTASEVRTFTAIDAM